MIICGEEDENGSENRENERLAGSRAKESHFGRRDCDESPARSEERGGGGQVSQKALPVIELQPRSQSSGHSFSAAGIMLRLHVARRCPRL